MAAVMLEKDKEKKKQEREAALSERLPPLQLSGLSMQDLQVCAGHCVTPPSIPLMYTEGRARSTRGQVAPLVRPPLSASAAIPSTDLTPSLKNIIVM